jgi:hypothetical protein
MMELLMEEQKEPPIPMKKIGPGFAAMSRNLASSARMMASEP